MEKIIIDRPIIVEGKYDKIKLSSILDANIITTEGFGIFSKSEKLSLIKRLAEPNGIIVMTDSDGAGTQIRAHISSAVPKNKIIHLYTPRVEGKEKRKKTHSKAGTLGVEGIDADKLREIFAPFSAEADENSKNTEPPITKADFFEDGLTGMDGAAEKRNRLAVNLGLPPNMTPNALLTALNIITTYSEYKKAVETLNENEDENDG